MKFIQLLKDKAVYLTSGIAIGILISILIFSKFFKPQVIVYQVPKIVKEGLTPRPDTLTHKPIVETIPAPCIRRWIPFAYTDSFIDISYWAYDSSANLRYEINGERFMYPVYIDKPNIIEKYKDYKLGIDIGLFYQYPYYIRPALGLRLYRLHILSTIEKNPFITLSINLWRW